MKTSAFSVIVILLLSFKPYEPNWRKATLPFEHLVYQSDLIVNGEISKVNPETYQFKVTKVIKGSLTVTEEIVIKKWREWECDQRENEYQPKQQLILFLRKDSSFSWTVINGSTGEKILKDNKYKEYHKLQIFESIEWIEKYFIKKGNRDTKITCSSKELEKFKSSNPFFEKLISNMEISESIVR